MLRRSLTLCPVGRQLIAARGFIGPPVPSFPRNVFDEVQRRCYDLEREFFGNRWSPFTAWRPFLYQHPTELEAFRLRNPIIEEDGVKKFKMEFDVRRFKPEDVKVSTNKEESTLLIEAKHKDECSSFEYSRRVSVPEGVKLTDITCKFTPDGVLIFEAPYEEPPQVEKAKEQTIKIDHQ